MEPLPPETDESAELKKAARVRVLLGLLAVAMVAAGLVSMFYPHGVAPTRKAKRPAAASQSSALNSPLSALDSQLPSEPPSPLADDLNSPRTTIQRDLAMLNDVLLAWQTNFRGDGNPVGENAEITAALTGKNPLNFQFIRRDHPAINERGELCDRWGTPFFFHALGRSRMEIRSAGPDREMYTADDAVFTP